MKCKLCGCKDFAHIDFWSLEGVSVQVCNQPVRLFACTNCGTVRVNDETVNQMQERK